MTTPTFTNHISTAALTYLVAALEAEAARQAERKLTAERLQAAYGVADLVDRMSFELDGGGLVTSMPTSVARTP